MAPKMDRRRWVVLILGIFALATAALCGLWWREVASALVTRLAFKEAEDLLAVQMGDDRVDRAKRLEEKFRFWFELGLLDRRAVVQKMPRDGLVPEAEAGFMVLHAYYQVAKASWKSNSLDEGEEIFKEYLRWLDPALLSPKSKEFLVNLLTGDWTLFNDQRESGAGLAKLYLVSFQFGGDPDGPLRDFLDNLGKDHAVWKKRCLAALRPEHWQAIRRDVKHPRDKVRAGSLLLLYHHPEEGVFLEEAVVALQDPSEWARLAAAGTLAIKGRRDGVSLLIQGLQHPRWEVRWWCGLGLTALGAKVYAMPLILQQKVENDTFLQEELGNMALVCLGGARIGHRNPGFEQYLEAATSSQFMGFLEYLYRFVETAKDALKTSCRIPDF